MEIKSWLVRVPGIELRVYWPTLKRQTLENANAKKSRPVMLTTAPYPIAFVANLVWVDKLFWYISRRNSVGAKWREWRWWLKV